MLSSVTCCCYINSFKVFFSLVSALLLVDEQNKNKSVKLIKNKKLINNYNYAYTNTHYFVIKVIESQYRL